MFREQSGAAGLSGRELPVDETLAADANVTVRAAAYKDSGAFPGALMDQLRATAYLDILNGIAADARITLGRLSTDGPDPAETPGAEPIVDPEGSDASGDPRDGDPEDGEPGDNQPPGAGPDGGPGGGGGSGQRGPGGKSPGKEPTDQADGAVRLGSGNGSIPPAFQGQRGDRPVLTDLTLPLVTLLGLANRPGEGHRLGVLDPELCRELAELAASSPYTRICITVTDSDGIAVGHGCGRARKLAGVPPGQLRTGALPSLATLPSRVNLTITADRLSALLCGARGSPGKSAMRTASGWAITRRQNDSPPDDPDWCGTWALALPGGRELAVRIEPVPTHDCDHRHESHGYVPNDTLRHLVQVRDYACTFPPCSRHARDSDWEHAQPYDKGGRTCACNGGARSRKCHRVKQSPGWNVTQPRPGWHAWSTPSGRTYTQAPYQYPV
jgi:hypothetical protein